ncbi:TPA: hypothetical protein ACGR8E_005461, partial [Klebsiella pneumoniae]
MTLPNGYNKIGACNHCYVKYVGFSVRFEPGFQQYRNYLIHRLMFNYGLRVGEVQLLTKDCVGPSLPDSRGSIRFILVIQNLPDNVDDPRKQQPSIKTEHSLG